MNYKISSSNFGQSFLKPLLEELLEYFNSINTKFFIIGAYARDLIMSTHNIKSGRQTLDLDIAIAISDWPVFKQIETDLLSFENFTKDPGLKQRFIYKNIYLLDIVPFGNIMNEKDKIFWPPDESFAMSVLGFSEVDAATQKMIIDDHLTIEIASLAGVFLLKIVAWNDRHVKSNKDADDMGFILTNYLTINEKRAIDNHYDIYEDRNFSVSTAGAKLLGRDIAEMLVKQFTTKNKIVQILQLEIDKKEESILINQMIETNKIFKYEEALKCIQNLVLGINDNTIK